MTTRREFLAAGASVAGLAAVGQGPLIPTGRPRDPSAGLAEPERARHPLRILILGGTSFLGPHQIAYAMGRGHAITTFTRGRTVPSVHGDLFKDVEMLTGDRENDLEALRGRTWDAVLDNSGRQVAWTRATAELLKDSVDIYLYVSSTGVYYPYLGDDISEETQPVLAVPGGDLDEGDRASYGYGVMKANSEIAAREVFGDDRTIAVRPTYMMGPGDPTDRFTYWPVRLALGGEVLVPGPRDPVQYIDIRDVASFMIRLVEERSGGTYNAVGPAAPTVTQQFVHGAHAAFSSTATFTAIDDQAFLREQRLLYAVPWIMPIEGNYGTARISPERALANGLTFHPLAQSVRDIHDWWSTDAVPQERKDTMLSGARSLIAREPAILSAWHALRG